MTSSRFAPVGQARRSGRLGNAATALVSVSLLTAVLSGCSAGSECGAGAASATEAVTELLALAGEAETVNDVCRYVTDDGAADDADVAALRSLAAEVAAADATFTEGGAMGTSVQVDVAAADGTAIHRFEVFSSQSNRWSVRIDDLAE